MSLGSNYCILPFIHTAIEANGDVKACCLTGAFKSDEGSSLNLNKHSLHEAFDSEHYKSFIETFRNNEKHPMCTKCWKDEATGTFSNRKKFNRKFAALLEEKERTGRLFERDFRYLEIKAGSLCNFKCRICGPHNSSRLSEEQAKYFNNPLALETVKLSRWVKDSNIWDHLKAFELNEVHIMGGEPFLDKNHLSLLDHWVETGRAKEISLVYNSNGSIFPEEHLKRFESFKKVRINFSLDDFGARFEYQRYPGRWDDIYENIRRLSHQPLDGLVLNVDICWSLMNIYYFDQIIPYFEEKMLSLPRMDKFAIKNGRHFYKGALFCPKKMPLRHKKMYLEKISSFERMFYDYSDLLTQLRNYVGTDERTEENNLGRIREIDRVRNQRFEDFFPELSFIFS